MSYLLDNQAAQAAARMDALSAIFDPVTSRHVEALGVAAGGRCWEVGAGGPAVPRMLAERVGPTGSVLATDIDIGWLTDPPPGVEVLRHDVANEDPPGTGFDLVHARLVLVHLPQRQEALRRMVTALRPGGWLLLEDFDVDLIRASCLDPRLPAEHRANRIRHGFVSLLDARGADLRYGRRMPSILRDAGLADVMADANFPVAHPATAALERANVAQVRDGLIGQGYATAEEIDEHLAALGDLDLATPPLFGAWGRRR